MRVESDAGNPKAERVVWERQLPRGSHVAQLVVKTADMGAYHLMIDTVVVQSYASARAAREIGEFLARDPRRAARAQELVLAYVA